MRKGITHCSDATDQTDMYMSWVGVGCLLLAPSTMSDGWLLPPGTREEQVSWQFGRALMGFQRLPARGLPPY